MSDHVVISKDRFVCLHCEGSIRLGFPIAVSDYVAQGKAFSATHRRCKKPRRGPVCHFCLRNGHDHMACPAVESFADWGECEDTGMSSEAVWKATLGLFSDKSYPFDPSDFGRCYRLIQRFPEAMGGVRALADRCGVWRHLAARWDDLVALYEEEAPSGKAPKLYALMQALERGLEGR